MATFTYQAKDNTGRSMSGLIEAGNPSLAAAALREQGLFPMKIETARGATKADFERLETPSSTPTLAPVGAQSKLEIAPFLNAIPLSEMAAMYRQMSTLLHAGVPMLQAITALGQQTRNSRLQRILAEAAAAVSAGHPFSAVMHQHPGVFSLMQVELIRAGETGGMMEQMCTRIADYLERELEIRRKIKRETLYPKIVLSVAGLVLLILGFVGAGMGQAGVAAVQAKLIFAAIVAASLFGVWWLVRFLNQIPAFGALWDEVKMLIPGAGGVARRYATARFTRALGALYAGGVLLPRAVEIAARACGNRAIGQKMVANVPILLSGGGLSGMLEQTGLLSPIAVQMARTGEQTGSLDIMMEKVADYLESEADTKAHQLAVSAGVGLLLIAAIVVGVIAVSFYAGYMGNLVNGTGGGGE